jgi:hypothetical protein
MGIHADFAATAAGRTRSLPRVDFGFGGVHNDLSRMTFTLALILPACQRLSRARRA